MYILNMTDFFGNFTAFVKHFLQLYNTEKYFCDDSFDSFCNTITTKKDFYNTKSIFTKSIFTKSIFTKSIFTKSIFTKGITEYLYKKYIYKAMRLACSSYIHRVS